MFYESEADQDQFREHLKLLTMMFTQNLAKLPGFTNMDANKVTNAFCSLVKVRVPVMKFWMNLFSGNPKQIFCKTNGKIDDDKVSYMKEYLDLQKGPLTAFARDWKQMFTTIDADYQKVKDLVNDKLHF